MEKCVPAPAGNLLVYFDYQVGRHNTPKPVKGYWMIYGTTETEETRERLDFAVIELFWDPKSRGLIPEQDDARFKCEIRNQQKTAKMLCHLCGASMKRVTFWPAELSFQPMRNWAKGNEQYDWLKYNSNKSVAGCSGAPIICDGVADGAATFMHIRDGKAISIPCMLDIAKKSISRSNDEEVKQDTSFEFNNFGLQKIN
jgi:hypothetical protein